ncbi:hypothetical protein MRQ36_16720 [Micromonospora sp. R77]|uniref:hypothetical protein n=1 Tax=Micromonospora sp. R77 TaxID=2925836 RepID=UPI001F60777A|nr:hypothetical protein [Micromonospora sp. R77]MCI4064153.1 hypothetical protein [Micromonospora sp. R77]
MPPVSGAPQPPAGGYPPPGGAYPPPQPPVSGSPYAPDPYAPQQPVSGSPYPPVSGSPLPPPPGGGYPPPPGQSYPPAPGQPFGPPPAKSGSKKNVWLIVGIVAAVLLLLCCGGGAFAVYSGAKKAEDVAKNLPTTAPIEPATTDPATTEPSATSTPDAGVTDGNTTNMKPGDTLIINDDDGTIRITVGNFRTTTTACKKYFPAPDEGMYLIADVTAEVTKGTSSINPFYFKWIASDGTETTGIGGAFSGCGKLLPSGNDLPTGSKRAGQLVFDVKDKNGTLEYEHKFKTAGSWKP